MAVRTQQKKATRSRVIVKALRGFLTLADHNVVSLRLSRSLKFSLGYILYLYSVEKCSIKNGGCSNGCTNPTKEGDPVTCDCKGTPMILDASGSKCGKFKIDLMFEIFA